MNGESTSVHFKSSTQIALRCMLISSLFLKKCKKQWHIGPPDTVQSIDKCIPWISHEMQRVICRYKNIYNLQATKMTWKQHSFLCFVSGGRSNTGLIPESDAVGVTVVLITCTYRGQEFIRIGYYVNNEYTDPELRENPPVKPNYTQVRHYIHAVLYSLMVRHEG